MKSILLIQGANMEWLGRRQPDLYGETSAILLDEWLHREARERKVALDIQYANIEGAAIDLIYDAARRNVCGILMNPAGFLYAGYALRDCLRGIALPCVEVHITNIENRGLKSVTAEAATGIIAGFGLNSYIIGLDALLRVINDTREKMASASQ